MPRRLLPFAAALAAAVTLVACSGSSGSASSTSTGGASTDAVSGAATTLDPVTVAAAGPESSQGSADTLPTIQPGHCPAVAAVPAPESVTDDHADVDGDGAEDQLASYMTGDQWHLRVSLAAGGGADVPLASAGDGTVNVLGGIDIDGQKGDEVLVAVGNVDAGTLVGMLRFHDCTLTRLLGPDGQPAAFPVGATATTANGLRCQPPGVVVREGTSSDGNSFATTDVTLQLQGDRFVEVSRQPGTVDATTTYRGEKLPDFAAESLRAQLEPWLALDRPPNGGPLALAAWRGIVRRSHHVPKFPAT
jgi:hypothetical protein